MRFPDHRLKLLFVCAHPAIDPGVAHAADAADRARARRRADRRRVPGAARHHEPAAGPGEGQIKAARIRFAVPEPPDLPERLGAVCEAIFGAYGAGWDEIGAADPRRRDLARRRRCSSPGRWSRLMPEGPEAKGLLAALLYSEARAGARRGPGGEYVPLAEQDTGLWDLAAIAEADAARWCRPAPADRFGRFQCMAAIQAVHAARAATGRTDAVALDLLYEALASLQPDGRGSRRPRRRPGRGARPGRRAGASRRAAAGARGCLPALLGGAGQPADAARRRRPAQARLPHGDQADDRPCGAGLPRRRTPSGRRSGVGLLRLPCSRPGDALGGPATRQFRGLFKRFPAGLPFRAARGFRC